MKDTAQKKHAVNTRVGAPMIASTGIFSRKKLAAQKKPSRWARILADYGIFGHRFIPVSPPSRLSGIQEEKLG